MSVLSEKVRAALYTKTNVGAVVGSGKLSGIFEGKAPTNQARPFGVFNRQASSPVTYAFNVTQVLETDFWQLRVYAESQSVAETMLNTWVSTLGNSLSISGGTVVWCARQMDLPPTDQQLTDRYIFGRGALIKICSE